MTLHPKLQLLADTEPGLATGLPRLASTYGPHVAQLAPIVEQLAQSPATKSDRSTLIQQIADVAGVSYRQANRFTLWLGVETPATPFSQARHEGSIRQLTERVTMKKAALDVIAGYGSAAETAVLTGFTPEGIRARVNKYLGPHKLTIMDLREMRQPARQALATLIEAEPVKQAPEFRPTLRRKRT